MKQITFGQDTIIIGRGATEPTAWAIARRISARRKNWHSVYHFHHGDFHRVTCFCGRAIGHLYKAGGFWWSAKTTVRDRAAALR